MDRRGDGTLFSMFNGDASWACVMTDGLGEGTRELFGLVRPIETVLSGDFSYSVMVPVGIFDPPPNDVDGGYPDWIEVLLPVRSVLSIAGTSVVNVVGGLMPMFDQTFLSRLEKLRKRDEAAVKEIVKQRVDELLPKLDELLARTLDSQGEQGRESDGVLQREDPVRDSRTG